MLNKEKIEEIEFEQDITKIKTLERFKEQLKNTSKDKILNMFYEQGLVLIEIKNRLEILKKELKKDEHRVYVNDVDEILEIIGGENE